MKKILFTGVLFVSLFQVSCSDDDGNSEENNAPNAAVLEISQESGLSIDLTWNQVIDEDGDTVTYDLFANDEIVETDLTTVDYMWTAEGREGFVYPIVFKVVSKDSNGGESISNEIVLDDPIIGTWFETFVADRLEDDSFSEFVDAQDIGVCGAQGVNSFVLLSDNNFTTETYDTEDGVTCFSRMTIGTWENVGNQNYLFNLVNDDGEEESVEIFFVFEGNTFNYESSDSSFIFERQ